MRQRLRGIAWPSRAGERSQNQRRARRTAVHGSRLAGCFSNEIRYRAADQVPVAHEGSKTEHPPSQPSNIPVIPTEAQRSGGICCFVGIDTHVRAAIPLPIKISTKDTATYEQPYFSFAISAQKSHVKPRNHLTPCTSVISALKFSYIQTAILDIEIK